MSYNIKKNIKIPKIYSQRRSRLIKGGGQHDELGMGNNEDKNQMDDDFEIAFPGARAQAAAARARAEAAAAAAAAAARARAEAIERAAAQPDAIAARNNVFKMIYIRQMQDILRTLPQPTYLQQMSGNADIINHRNDLEAMYTVMRNHFAQGPFTYDATKDVLFDIFEHPHFDKINVNRYFDDNENSRRCKHFMKKICDLRMNKNVQTSTRCDKFVQAVHDHRYHPANEERDEEGYVEMREFGGNKRKSNKRMIIKSNKRMIKRKSNKRKTNKIIK